VGEGGTYGFAGIESARFEEPVAGRLARFRERFAGFGGPVPEFLAGLERDEDLHCGPSRTRSCWPSWRSSRRGAGRAAWVAEQSRIANRAWLLPPAVRDGVLRERGDGMLRERYAPLVAAP
jgi:hypothetical protein